MVKLFCVINFCQIEQQQKYSDYAKVKIDIIYVCSYVAATVHAAKSQDC